MSDHELTQLNSKENNLLGMFAQVTGVKSNSQEPLDSPKVVHCSTENTVEEHTKPIAQHFVREKYKQKQ